MSKIALTGNALGTGTLTIASPNTNTDRTLTLPNNGGTLLTKEFPAGTAAAPSITPLGDTDTGIFSPALNTLAYSTTGVERMRIDGDGNVGIGFTVSGGAERLSVGGGAGSYLARFYNTNASIPFGLYVVYNASAPNFAGNEFFVCADTAAVRMTVRSNGGIVNYTANNVAISDERVKTNISPLGSYWDKIKAVEVVTYKYKDQTHADDNIGVIAQQLEAVAPEFVSNEGFGETPEDGVPLKTVYEADLHYATLKALQEAMARIEVLEARITVLEQPT